MPRRPGCLPRRFPDPPRLRPPLLLPRRVIPVRRHAPVLVVAPVDPAGSAELHAVLASLRARDDRDRNAPTDPRELDRLAAEPARAAPHQDDIVGLDGVAGPAG